MGNEVTVKVGADIQSYQRAMGQVVADARRTSTAVTSAFGGAASGIRNVFQGVFRSIQLIGAHLLGIRTALAGLVGGFLAVRFVQGFIAAGAEMEKFKLQILAAHKGIRAAADEALDSVIEFARATPFTTKEVVEGFSLLKSAGLSATEDVLQAIGGLSFIFNRQFNDVAMAMVSQEAEVLRRLGIMIDRTGDEVVIQSGSIIKRISGTREQVFAAMIELIQERFPNALKGAEKTWAGAMANFFSLFEEMRYRVGERITKALVPKINEFIALWDELSKSGSMAKIEKTIERLTVKAVSGFADMLTWAVRWADANAG